MIFVDYPPYFLIIILLVFCTRNQTTAQELLVIQTNSGKVQGFTTTTASTGKQVDQWLGIPYAEKPLGDLRFRHPQSVNSWDGIYNATANPNSCVQTVDTFFGNFPGSTMWNANTHLSEDCLYLSITVPKPRPLNATVMVWIYGGGFSTGTITLDVYDPKVMASEENVIVAAIQYRLSSLGFLYFGSDNAPGNTGLFDQLMGIQWIHDNIAAFGGDPYRITLFGESAGASSVSTHVLSPLSENLISRAILQSGAVTSSWSTMTKDDIISNGLQLAEAVGCSTSESIENIIKCLKTVNAEILINNDISFLPTMDGKMITQNYTSSYENISTSILVGSNSEEGFYFLMYSLPQLLPLEEDVLVNRTEYLKAIDTIYSEESNIIKHAIAFHYTNWFNPDDSVSNRDALDKMYGDYSFTCPVYEFAENFAKVGNKVFMYHFTRRSEVSPWPSWSGVLHADEIPFIFGEPLDISKNYPSEEIELSKNMMRYWANFAKTGDPNTSPDGNSTAVFWPRYTVTEKNYLQLDVFSNSNASGDSLRVEQCVFWGTYIPELKLMIEYNAASTATTNHSTQLIFLITYLYFLFRTSGINE